MSRFNQRRRGNAPGGVPINVDIDTILDHLEMAGQGAFGQEHKWVIPYYLDVGTGDSDTTWQASLGLGYAFGWGDVTVAWRYLDYELKSGAPIADLSLNGPAVGVTFRW
ncbi:hypothetical protein [Steroidobacter agaridevorans]|uniref:hypothetical protein n=1 Tax=Steroidobacter agaridevorans TaxID=2695856 RepID=UPI00137B026D|nr:hypothetical protein [Steroidobacter agaridevorans]